MSQHRHDKIPTAEGVKTQVKLSRNSDVELFLPEDPASFHRADSGLRSSIWHRICLAMHASSTILHFVMIFVMHFQLEKRLKVQLGSQSDTLSLKLFMHRLLVKHQTLTQSHDQYASWLGLGSGVSALFKQRNARAGYKWVLLITTYLAASAVMKITTAALFHLTPTTSVTSKETAASSIHSEALTSIMRRPKDLTQSDYMADNLRETMVLEKLRLGTWELSPTVDSLGLHGNLLYDVLPQVANVTGAVNVTAITVNAACHTVSTKDFINMNSDINGVGAIYPLGWRSVPLSAAGNTREVKGGSNLPPTFVVPFQSMYGIEDTQGNTLKGIPFSQVLIDAYPLTFLVDEPVARNYVNMKNVNKCPSGLGLTVDSPFTSRRTTDGPYNVTSELGLMACSLSWSSASVVVNAEYRTPVDTPKRKSQSWWSEFSLATLSFAEATSFPIFGLLERALPGSSTFTFKCNPPVTGTGLLDRTHWSVDWSSFDLFVLIANAYRSFSDNYLGLSNQSIPPRIKLHEFENMLEDWAAMNFYIHNKVNVLTKLGDTEPTSVSVSVRTQVSQLQLRALPVFGGLAASLVMLSIAATIVFTTPALRSQPKEIGVLQLLWLSDLKFDLGRLEAPPTEVNLRRAGLALVVSLVDGLGEFRRQGKTD
ncbi:hypothetical protein DL96DRAFT_1685042 [Flagelloscypha sp. PMI_526]|nr:hypothetical protein DL96DRAFT_1685042 [Flagelloscypha sp. PMI_526]